MPKTLSSLPPFVVLILLLSFGHIQVAAQPASNGIAEIEKALENKNIKAAEKILAAATEAYWRQAKADSLVNYIFYVGKIEQAKNNPAAIKKVEAFVEKIKLLNPSPTSVRQAYVNAGEYYGSVGNNSKAYEANQQAYSYTSAIAGVRPSRFGLIENNLSTYAQRMGDLALSQMHSRQAMQHFIKDAVPEYEGLYIAYNGMGATMWYASKNDSALFYFNKALQTLDKTPRNPLNSYYRKAIVYNNVAGLYSIEGNTAQAIHAMKSCISNLKSFLADPEPNPKKVTAITFQFEAIENLAGIYKELGDMRQAKSLLEHSHEQKLKKLNPGDPGIFIAKILLGQLYYATGHYDKALSFLNEGLSLIQQADDDYQIWQAEANSTLALLYDARKDVAKATRHYEKTDSLYEAALQGDYDFIYLDFLGNASKFYAENNHTSLAIAKATKGYNYVVKTQGAQTLLAFYQLLNLAEVYLQCGQAATSLRYSNQALSVVNNKIKQSENILDSIKTELKKPKAILLQAKAQYQLLQQKDVATLNEIVARLNEALQVLDRRKEILKDADDVRLVMADHAELIEFIKKLTLDVYQLSHKQADLDRLISLHESSMYNRLRSRLNKNDSLRFSHVPAATQRKERALKAALAVSLQQPGSHDEKMQHYFAAADNWNRQKEHLKKAYPKYYQFRYASIFKPIGEVQNIMPENTTLIRYFFIDEALYALVTDRKQKQLYKLNANGLQQKIDRLAGTTLALAPTGDILHSLYQQLWQPLTPSIRHTKIIVIPDGNLYNLNFDILTPKRISSYKDLATNSLLASYSISYQFSLFLLDKKSSNTGLNNFVGFAPGFTDNLKSAYRQSVNDSATTDGSYLSLLPQPFTLSLVSDLTRLLGGNSYLFERSTEEVFKQNAGDHQIIHIGTHAESNNEYPEYSRLIFAKGNDVNEDNSLYVDEIYNCNLASNLTVLTACETGKPGYKDGEGMISLAHAFNYAGSQSILTGLWKIDEQASAVLMELFYKNLLLGMPKDEALRQSKLRYLQQAEGRMLAPTYWAGLVLVGDTSPIQLQNQTSRWLWFLLPALLLVVGLFIMYKRSRKV